MTMPLLNKRLKDLQFKFKLLTEKIEELDTVTRDFLNLPNILDDDKEEYNINRKEIHHDIDMVMQDIVDLFKDKQVHTLPLHYFCDFHEHCPHCIKIKDLGEAYEFCKNSCDTCCDYRKVKLSYKKKMRHDYYDNHIISKEELEYKNRIKNKKPVQLITNNVTININNNYIETKDLFFHVTITTSQQNAEEKLKYLFTYLMCGASGKMLFPNESKHSKSVTFPVLAARYSIDNIDNNYTLNGCLRFQYIKGTCMTIKKLENICKDHDVTIKITSPSLYNNTKYQFLKEDIDNMLTYMVNPIGSKIEDFYL